MTVNPVSQSAAMAAIEFEMLVLEKNQDVAKDVSQSLVALVQPVPKGAAAAAPPPGRIDTYA